MIISVLRIVAAAMMLLPVAAGGSFSGNGTAGCGSVAQQTELLGPTGGWCLTWGDCDGRADCLPMVRERFLPGDWNPEQTAEIMHTCGSQPCAGLVMLNDPLRTGQDTTCNATCQATTLHDYAPVAQAENQKAFIIFGNWPTAKSEAVQPFVDAWQNLYPGEDLKAFMATYHVKIGIHHYANTQYTPLVYQKKLVRFQRWVKDNLGVAVVVTEWGGLYSGEAWKTVIADQKPWFTQRGIMNAVYTSSTNSGQYCCAMLLGDGLSEYGEWYRDH